MTEKHAEYKELLKNAPGVYHDMLNDLVFWEAKVEQLKKDVAKFGEFTEYYDKEGFVKHVQPSVYNLGLAKAQDKVDKLRYKLVRAFEKYAPKKAKNQLSVVDSAPETDEKPAETPILRHVKNF